MKRKIYDDLLNWKNNENKPLIVLGARQVGKTYIINEFCENEYTNYKSINLLNNQNIVDLYRSNQNSLNKYQQLKVLLNFNPEEKDSILFVDEVQESEEFISDLKFFNEEYPNVKIIVAGSLLGIQLKRSKKAFPVGKVNILNMYPMDFEEFLIALERNDLIELIDDCFLNNKQMPLQIHELLLNYYKEYLILGGMPESIQNYLNNNNDISNIDSNILNNINYAYINDMNRYVKNENESLYIRNIYNSIPSQLGNKSHKFQYSKITKGAKSITYTNALNWLINSALINMSYAINNPSKPIKGFIEDNIFKVYLCDIGLLNRLLNINFREIINDSLGLYKGIISENYVSQQLISNNIPLYYWRSNNEAEVDFLIETKDGVIPIEVKSADNTKSKSLKSYIDKYNPSYSIKISSKNFGMDNNIKSIPLYATYKIKSLL